MVIEHFLIALVRGHVLLQISPSMMLEVVARDAIDQVGGFPFNIDPFECVTFSTNLLWLFPCKLIFIEDTVVYAFPRRTLKEKDLGPVEGILTRTTGVREGKIIYGDYEEEKPATKKKTATSVKCWLICEHKSRPELSLLSMTLTSRVG